MSGRHAYLYRHALGQVLRDLRSRRGLTLQAAGSLAGVSFTYISQVERGHKEISSELLAALAPVLGSSVGDVAVESGRVLAGWELTSRLDEELARLQPATSPR